MAGTFEHSGRSAYADVIIEATGMTDLEMIAEIEDCMRHDIFHSTLDWQTRDQLHEAAMEAYRIVFPRMLEEMT